MDLEELNKTQIILLTLLVSFVSAIATSIFTVKILEQAPPAVTQTINRVVERTVERVVPPNPGELASNEPTTVVEKETTVVVKEDDLITESIEKNKATLARLVIVTEGEETTETPEQTGTSTEQAQPIEESFVGMGVFLRNDGLIATTDTIAQTEGLRAMTHTGVILETEVVSVDSESGLGFVQLVIPEGTSRPNYRVATFVDVSSLKLGQTVISLGGEQRTNVSMGIISSLIDTTVSAGETQTSVVGTVATNINNNIPGQPLINIFGELVGIDLTGDSSGAYYGSALLQQELTSFADTNDTALETTEAEASIEG